MFSVNVLLYGDYPDLHARCLGSLRKKLDPAYVADVRIGLNAATPAVRRAALDFALDLPVACHVYEEAAGRNVLKYPLMRRMFYDPERPLPGSHVVWVDDDSYLKADFSWAALAREVRDASPVVLGSPYKSGYTWNVHEQAAIKAQPWYGKQDLNVRPMFMTGGWWVADKEFLSKWDYPVRELRHNGGDVLLGEIVRQQQGKLCHYKTGVAINADAAGRESRAERRGTTTPRPFEKPPPYDYSHHDFKVLVWSYRRSRGA